LKFLKDFGRMLMNFEAFAEEILQGNENTLARDVFLHGKLAFLEKELP
jgi:hypothetical protein